MLKIWKSSECSVNMKHLWKRRQRNISDQWPIIGSGGSYKYVLIYRGWWEGGERKGKIYDRVENRKEGDTNVGPVFKNICQEQVKWKDVYELWITSEKKIECWKYEMQDFNSCLSETVGFNVEPWGLRCAKLEDKLPFLKLTFQQFRYPDTQRSDSGLKYWDFFSRTSTKMLLKSENAFWEKSHM